MPRLLLIAAALACLAAGCGSVTGEDRPGEEATLLLDFTPNAVHSGIYMAVDRDFDDAEGVSLTVRKPGASTDALKLLAAAAPTSPSSTSTTSGWPGSRARTSSA